MAKLVSSISTSLDGYVCDAEGGFAWAAPSPEVHAAVNARKRAIGTYLFGRRLYETMRVWDELDPGDDAEMREYQEIWRGIDKVVYSATLPEVTTARTRLERAFDPAAVRAFVDDAERDVSMGGPTLTGSALAAGIVDEVELLVVPVLVGAGTRVLPDGVHASLALLEERRFVNGTVALRYGVRASGR